MTRGEADAWAIKARRAGFEKNKDRGWMLRLLDRLSAGEVIPLSTEQMLIRGLKNTLEQNQKGSD